jgi:hypothetical protein
LPLACGGALNTIRGVSMTSPSFRVYHLSPYTLWYPFPKYNYDTLAALDILPDNKRRKVIVALTPDAFASGLSRAVRASAQVNISSPKQQPDNLNAEPKTQKDS